MSTDRYRRQILVPEFGQKGQDLLSKKHAVVIGCGGLGSHSSEILVRMGIGSITAIDNDVIDQTNLHRTSLFEEDDIGKSKALVLQEKLSAINSEVRVIGVKRVVIQDNITDLVRGADVIVDGTDSMPLRFLINEVSIKRAIPWVYAGVYETVGMVMGIRPKNTPCFQCLSQTIPEESSGETPVFGSLPAIIGSIQCNETIKLLLNRSLAGLIIYDIWRQCFETMRIEKNPRCPKCGINK